MHERKEVTMNALFLRSIKFHKTYFLCSPNLSALLSPAWKGERQTQQSDHKRLRSLELAQPLGPHHHDLPHHTPSHSAVTCPSPSTCIWTV